MVKVKVKICGCFRKLKGAKRFLRIRGYISSLRRQGEGVIEGLEAGIRGEGLKYLSCVMVRVRDLTKREFGGMIAYRLSSYEVFMGARIVKSVTTCGLCALALLPISSTEVKVNTAVKYQKILGWGKTTPEMPVSLMLRDQILYWAVDDLGLTRLRLEPPSGNRSQCQRWEWENDNGNPESTDWSKFNIEALDTKVSDWVVPFKKKVEARGEPFDIYISPSFFNGGSTGEAPAWLINSPAEYAEFALSLITRLKEEHNITTTYYSICNEAGNNNYFNPGVTRRMAVYLGRKLKELGLPTKIQYPECINADTSWRYIVPFRNDRELWRYVGLISYHLYGKNDARAKIYEFAKSKGIPTAQTEFMGLRIDHLYDDLTIGGVSYWEIYGLAGPVFRDPLSHIDTSSFRGGPSYWYFRQVMHYVRPGAVRVEAASDDPSLRVLAFVQKNGTTVVLINTARPLKPRKLSISGLTPAQYGLSQSVRRRPYRELGVRQVGQKGELQVELPADSVLTIYPYEGNNLAPVLTQWRVGPVPLHLPQTTVSLTASATDPELDKLSFRWKVMQRPDGADVKLQNANKASATATGLSVPGQYIFSISVSDATHTVEQKLAVMQYSDNQPPWIIDLHNRIPVMVIHPQMMTHLRAGGFDIERDRLSFRWRVVSKPEGSSVRIDTPERRACRALDMDVPGEYVFRFEVNDGKSTASEDLKVTVYPESRTPIISKLTASPSEITLPISTVTLSAKTMDPDGYPVTHWWSVVSCPAGAKPLFEKQGSPRSVVRGLTIAGSYTFRLSAINRQKVGTRDITVSVFPNPEELKKLKVSDPPDIRSGGGETIARGIVIGVVKARDSKWIEVTSQTGKTARYIPPWRGGSPRDGAGLDKSILSAIAKLKAGERVRLIWRIDRHLRVEHIERIKSQ